MIVTLSGAKERLRAGLSSRLNGGDELWDILRQVDARVRSLEQSADRAELRRAHARAALFDEHPPTNDDAVGGATAATR